VKRTIFRVAPNEAKEQIVVIRVGAAVKRERRKESFIVKGTSSTIYRHSNNKNSLSDHTSRLIIVAPTFPRILRGAK
jgi:hypothetical protein